MLIPSVIQAEIVSYDNWVVTGTDTVNKQFFFAQDPSNRVGGVKVLPSTTPIVNINIGDRVNISGDFQMFCTERRIINANVTFPGGSATVPKPLGINHKAFSDSVNGIGAPIAGKLVSVWGKISPSDSGVSQGYLYLFIDDGAGVWDPINKTIGVKVYYNPADYPDMNATFGLFYIIRGIASVEQSGNAIIPIIWAQNITFAQ